MSYGMNGWNKEIPGGDTISRAAAIDALDEINAEVEDGYGFDYAKWRVHFRVLPSAQPDKSVIEDCLYRIRRNTSSHTSAEGVVAIKYYMGKLWRELFGEEDVPEWMI